MNDKFTGFQNALSEFAEFHNPPEVPVVDMGKLYRQAKAYAEAYKRSNPAMTEQEYDWHLVTQLVYLYNERI